MSIPSSLTPLFSTGSSAAAGGYQVSRSLRFNSADSAYLSRTPAVAGSRTTWTWAAWVKRSVLATDQRSLFYSGTGTGDDNYFQLGFYQDNLSIILYSTFSLVTSQVFRDVSAWYHIVCVVDTSNGTANNRLRLYVNGSEITNFSTRNNPTPSQTLAINKASVRHDIGVQETAYGFNGYMADIHFIDGQALTPSSFTEVSATTGQLIPKAYSGTYTGNSFWLKFSDNSAATAATLGKDYSGNSNNWTPNNFSITNYVNYSSGWNANAVQPTKSFDGSTSGENGTYAVVGATASWSGNIPCSGTVRMYVTRQSNTSGDTLTVNGTSVIPAAGTDDWVNITSAAGSAITSIQTYRASDVSYSVTFVKAIEVNGTVLVDNTGAGNDSLVDTPTSISATDTGVGGEIRGNYCTLNPLDNGGLTLANGNLDFSRTTASWLSSRSTFGISSGKWYWEVTLSTGNDCMAGISKNDAALSSYFANVANGWAYNAQNGQKYNNGSSSAYGNSWIGGNDTVGVAFDADAGSIYFYKNGAVQNSGNAAFTGLTSGPYFPSVALYGTGTAFINFGQRPFAYQTPGTNRPAATYKALCDTNLPAPLTAMPNTLMTAYLYTGNGSTAGRSLTGVGFSPDLVWIKDRSAGNWHQLRSTLQNGIMHSNDTAAEQTSNANGIIGSLDSDGFTLSTSTNTPVLNTNNNAYVAWTWDAGSSTVSNTAGSITSQVRANVSAGFSVVTFTGAGATATIGHGLGVEPHWIIVKNRTGSADNWSVYTKTSGAGNQIYLNLTNAVGGGSVFPSAPTSTLMTIGGGYVGSTIQSVAYCFSPVVGYSSFGSYTGNGSTDGPFVYTGFRPKFILGKVSSTTNGWYIFDAARSPYNVTDQYFAANASAAESTFTFADFLSNGFKLRATTSDWNASGQTYIFAAFAENPLQYARAR